MSKYIHQQQNKINDLQVKISELKAENEMLKKYETIYYLNQLQASNEDIDKFKQNQIQQSINISYLLKDNTKQVCEKIKVALRKQVRKMNDDEHCYPQSAVHWQDVVAILDQIEKGE